jgi:hypothetical protein
VAAFEAVCRGFESLRARQTKQDKGFTVHLLFGLLSRGGSSAHYPEEAEGALYHDATFATQSLSNRKKLKSLDLDALGTLHSAG